MKLYIPTLILQYEGGVILGVFDTKEKARNRIDRYTEKGLSRSFDEEHIYVATLNTNEEIDIWNIMYIQIL